jgi:NADH-quinone oxidoreductase subunit M
VTRHLLPLIALLPLAGALVLASVGRDRDRLLRAIAWTTTALVFAAAARLALVFEPRGPEWQFTERVDLLPSIGASYSVGVDGLGMILILLTAGLSVIAVLASWASVANRLQAFYVAVLTLEAGMLGVYMALDLLLFCLCWVLAAASMCVLIASAGQGAPGWTPGHGRRQTLVRVAVIAIGPGLVILAGMLVLHVEGRALTGAQTFDLRLFQHLTLPVAAQRWVFVAFCVGFGAGLLGVFRWWVTVAADGRAVAVPVLLAAVFLKMGTFGFLRLSLPLLPDAARAFAPALMTVSAIGIVFTAVAAFAQTSWTRVLAYASLSHLCLVMLGAFTLTPDGLTGSAVHQINHGVSIAALFLVAGLVAERVRGAALADYGGLLNAMPLVAAVSLLMTLSLMGVPKLNGFVGMRLIAASTWSGHRGWSVVAMVGMALSGVALFWLFARTMLGELRSPAGGAPKDLRATEALVFVPLVALVLWVGLRPALLLARVETSVARIVLRVSPQFAPEVADCLTQSAPAPVDTGLPAGMVLAAPCADGTGSPPSLPTAQEPKP